MKALFKKGLHGLHPADSNAESWLGGLRLHEIVQGEFTRPRNIAHHQKFFALLTLIHQNQTHYKSVDDILLAFKYHIGHGHWVMTRGRFDPIEDDLKVLQIFQPHSISFAKMDQDAFNEFYGKALDFVTTVVIPGLSKDDLIAELWEFAA